MLDNQINQSVVGYVIYMLGNIQSQGVEKQLRSILVLLQRVMTKKSYRDQATTIITNHVSGPFVPTVVNPPESNIGSQTIPKRIQNLNIEELSQYTKKEVMPFVFQPRNLESWPYEFLWRPTAMKSEKHFGYSVQWFMSSGYCCF
ncbi:hypothetical protein O9992_26145 [Vibrio lentus]|nr:hypothetical protein [Vibrio lentus]